MREKFLPSMATSSSGEEGMDLTKWLQTNGLDKIRKDLIDNDMTLDAMKQCRETDIRYSIIFL